jgi:hypothetical protein
MVVINPFTAPYLDMADMPYSEQVGQKTHTRTLLADIL